jgi:GNAT superfamily N-acetyltransferase
VAAVEIRAGVPRDVPVLRDVFRRSSLANEGDRPLFDVHPELLDWADTPLREQRTRVALVDGRIVGFASLIVGDGVAELEDLFVEPESMRHGVGRALTDDAAAIARARGLAAVEVSANPHAREFYARVGFEERGMAPVEYGTAYRMHLDLRRDEWQ